LIDRHTLAGSQLTGPDSGGPAGSLTSGICRCAGAGRPGCFEELAPGDRLDEPVQAGTVLTTRPAHMIRAGSTSGLGIGRTSAGGVRVRGR
jgi:hypothetical protein